MTPLSSLGVHAVLTHACDQFYSAVLSAGRASCVGLAEFLRTELPELWVDDYAQMRPSRANVVVFHHGTFDYIYDLYDALEPRAIQHPIDEARLIAAIGVSAPKTAPRDDYRLRGWVGATGRLFGPSWDKGHFIAHSIGGAVDGMEANVFLQNRALNRGWSDAGRRFRAMERFCFLNGGALCFSRPIYGDGTARPDFVEFGVLKSGDDLWVERFDNR